jgi:rubrerythrin
MDISSTLRRAEEVEEIAADIYHALADRSAAAPAYVALFHRLENEEHEHARRLQMLGSMYIHDPASFRNVRLEIADMDAIVAETKAFRDAVKRGEFEVGTAMARMVDLEERFAVTHAEEVAREAAPGVKALFTMLASQDREHIRLLQTHRIAPA